ncbi:MAG TPA: zinc finger domain-containing protein [Candidatus Bathyarchaeia archaeon]|nr:zinc finger domain-containing protein [Candidatus Bathyarchaeia archaeon]
MAEKTATSLSLTTCTSCGKPIAPGSESTKFLCPQCGEIQIKRDGKCRKFGRPYKCPKCGFTGP